MTMTPLGEYLAVCRALPELRGHPLARHDELLGHRLNGQGQRQVGDLAALEPHAARRRRRNLRPVL